MNNLSKNIILFPFNVLYKFNKEITLKILFRLKTGYKLDLKEPKSYNQKLQWLKLYDKNQIKTQCCDKYLVRKYVEEKGIKEILVPIYWEGFCIDDIPFEKLPNKFVIKVTHGSTFNIICKNKNELDIKNCKRKLEKWLKAKFLKCYGEWYYGVEKPRIIVEKYLESNNNQLDDYKVFCFNGEPKFIRVDSGRFTTNHTKDIYNIKWEKIDGVKMGYKNSNKLIDKPRFLKEMLEYAKILSEDFLHARIDFYIVNDRIYFGEITFANGAGFDRITPREFDEEMGKWLILPKF